MDRDQNGFRPLRPAFKPDSDSSSSKPDESPTPSGSLTNLLLLKKRNRITKVACNSCRAKKSGCDAKRPICSACQTRGSPCVYTSQDESETPAMALKRENETLRQSILIMETLVNHLRNTPEGVAHDTLQRLRATSDITSVLPQPDLNFPLSGFAGQSALGHLPSALNTSYELDQMAQHPNAYPISGRDLLGTSQPLQSTKRQKMGHDANLANGFQGSSSGEQQDGIALSFDDLAHDHQASQIPRRPDFKSIISSDYLKTLSSSGPQVVQGYFDAQLQLVNIGFWTLVPVTNKYAAGVISLYLATDHPLLGLFDAELFVGDLVTGTQDFCSPFLVSSLLAFASQAYASRDSTAVSRSYEFEAEAERLWTVEKRHDNSTTIAALTFLFLSMGCHGRGEEAKKYTNEVTEMGMRLRLFGVDNALDAKDTTSLSGDTQSQSSYAAWGGFNTLTLFTLFDLAKPLLYPPRLPIPGMVQTESDATTSLNSSIGHGFAYFCKLWKIVVEIQYIYRQKDDRTTPVLAFALSRYHKILALMDGLPENMTRDYIGDGQFVHIVLQFHMWVHNVILDIFRPFVISTGAEPPADKSSSTVGSSPESILLSSVTQIKHLILVFRNHPVASYSVFWHGALMYTANAVLKNKFDFDRRCYFLICIECYQVLYKSFDVVESMVQSLLAMALGERVLGVSEANRLMQELQAQRKDSKLASKDPAHQRLVGSFIVDRDLALRDPKAASVDSLVDRFEEITLFNEFVNETNTNIIDKD